MLTILPLAKRQRFRLRKEVAQQDLVMPVRVLSGVSLQVILALHGSQEVGGDELRSLMQQLVKRVLAIRTSRSPNDGTGLVLDTVARFSDRFAVGFHVALGKALEAPRSQI